MDIACIVAASPLLAVISLPVVVLIKLVSRGPVLYRQERIGFRGQPFKCLKFRTMAVDADASKHEEHVIELMSSGQQLTKLDAAGDTRLIRGGWWLRACGLDELPQVLNVLRGEMSLVGPRPCMAYESQKYTPGDWRRFETLPGLTGLWQVKGKNSTSFEEMIALDVYYVDHKSLLLDLWIIARTIPAIIGQVVTQRRQLRRGGGVR